MKKYVKEYLTLLTNVLLIICFAIASYLILINFYHYKEISKKYNYNISQKAEYEKFKNDIIELENNANSIRINNKNEKYNIYLTSINDQFKRCIFKIKESNYYNLKRNVGLVDIYNFNNDMYKNLQTECLYMLNLKINEGKEKYNLNINYSLEEKLIDKRKDIIYISSYLSDKMSSNSSYYYTSELTKTTIFNDIKYSMDLTMNNYSTLKEELKEIQNWYLKEVKKVGDN